MYCVEIMFDIVCYILENFLNNDLCKWKMLFFNFSFVKFWYMEKNYGYIILIVI